MAEFLSGMKRTVRCGEVTADTVEYRGMHICAACRRAISQL